MEEPSADRMMEELKIWDVEYTKTELGRGSYATVLEARWAGRPCAVKELHSVLNSEMSRADFRKECILWSQFRHSCIVKLLGFHFKELGRDQQVPKEAVPNLVMEKMGPSLRVYLERHGKNEFTLAQKARALQEVAQGLEYLHGHNPPFVHRDLTTNNVLLTEEHLTAKITDFGMSRAISQSGMMTKLTENHLGTLHFMPPEAFSQPLKFNEKLDVFSFGNIVLHTVTHQWPEPLNATQYKSLQGGGHSGLIALDEFQRREHFTELFSKEEKCIFLGLIKDCLQYKPEWRPSSLELVERLRKITAEETKTQQATQQPSPLAQVCKTVSRGIVSVDEKIQKSQDFGRDLLQVAQDMLDAYGELVQAVTEAQENRVQCYAAAAEAQAREMVHSQLEIQLASAQESQQHAQREFTHSQQLVRHAQQQVEDHKSHLEEKQQEATAIEGELEQQRVQSEGAMQQSESTEKRIVEVKDRLEQCKLEAKRAKQIEKEAKEAVDMESIQEANLERAGWIAQEEEVQLDEARKQLQLTLARADESKYLVKEAEDAKKEKERQLEAAQHRLKEAKELFLQVKQKGTESDKELQEANHAIQEAFSSTRIDRMKVEEAHRAVEEAQMKSQVSGQRMQLEQQQVDETSQQLQDAQQAYQRISQRLGEEKEADDRTSSLTVVPMQIKWMTTKSNLLAQQALRREQEAAQKQLLRATVRQEQAKWRLEEEQKRADRDKEHLQLAMEQYGLVQEQSKETWMLATKANQQVQDVHVKHTQISLQIQEQLKEVENAKREVYEAAMAVDEAHWTLQQRHITAEEKFLFVKIAEEKVQFLEAEAKPNDCDTALQTTSHAVQQRLKEATQQAKQASGDVLKATSELCLAEKELVTTQLAALKAVHKVKETENKFQQMNQIVTILQDLADSSVQRLELYQEQLEGRRQQLERACQQADSAAKDLHESEEETKKTKDWRDQLVGKQVDQYGQKRQATTEAAKRLQSVVMEVRDSHRSLQQDWAQIMETTQQMDAMLPSRTAT